MKRRAPLIACFEEHPEHPPGGIELLHAARVVESAVRVTVDDPVARECPADSALTDILELGETINCSVSRVRV